MPMFRKKPVVIEARQLTEDNMDELVEWAGGKDRSVLAYREGVVITTLERQMRADLGDWIIKGVKGEFYPCTPDIFEMTYEAVQE